MIGIFDSGSGGLSFLAALRRSHPEWSYVYHADYDHCPYGEKTADEIYDLTYRGVTKLFDAGAQIVILACNTASAWSLRRFQNGVFPNKTVLGVTIPGVEKVIEYGCQHTIVFATEKTVQSHLYAQKIHDLNPAMDVTEIPFSGELVREIESLLPIQRCANARDFDILFSLYGDTGWECDSREWHELTRKYFEKFDFEVMNADSTALVLGCTHYAFLQKSLQTLFPLSRIIDPSFESALKLDDYFSRKQKLFDTIGKTNELIFLS